MNNFFIQIVRKKIDRMKYYYVYCTVLVILARESMGAMTEAQMKSASKMIRNVCQPKAKVTDEQIENTHKGVFPADEGLACYFKCVLQMMKITKNTEFLVDAAIAQLPQLPEARREPTKSAIDHCQNAGDGETNKCQFAYKIAQCFYSDNPSNYFLP